MVVGVKPRCCDACAPCTGEFKKVVNLPYSGLVIYIHKKSDNQDDAVFAANEGLIFHNTTNKEINKPKYIDELCQYKTEYSHIKNVIKRVRSLLNEVLVIKGNQVIGVCEHCKKANTTKQCKRCEHIVSEFLADKKIRVDDRQQRFKEWVVKVKQLLQSILNAHSVCKHMAYKDTELENILKELRTPLSMRMPIIDFFPNIEADQLMTQSITESKEMLDELLNRIQCEGVHKPMSSNDSLCPSPSGYKETCICKLVKEGHSLEHEISTLTVDRSVSLSETDLRTYSKMLVIDLMQKLQDLRRALILNEFSKADKILTDNLAKNINHVNKHGLLPQSANSLMDQITELSKTLPYDEKAAKKYKDLIDDLLAELKRCKIMTQGFSKHLLKVLVHVCKSTADQLSNDADSIRSKGKKSYTQHPKFSSQQYLDKRSVSTLPKESRQVLLKDKEDRKERSKIGAKKFKQTLSDESPQEVVSKLHFRPDVGKAMSRQISTEILKEEDKTSLKDTTSRILKGEPLALKGEPKEGTLRKSRPSRMLKDESKEGEKVTSKDVESKIFKDGSKAKVKEGFKPFFFKEGSKHGGIPLPKDMISRTFKDEQKAMSKDTASRLVKGGPKEESKVLLKDSASRAAIDRQKELKKVTSKASPKSKGSPKETDLHKDEAKEATHALAKELTIQPSKAKQKDTRSVLPKEPVDVSKPRDKGAGKDAGDEVLKARLLELGRALSQGLSQTLDKDLVRELTNNLKNAINKDTRNVTKGVIEALTDVCSRLAKGIPKNLNKGPVIDLLEEMNEIFTRGLSSDQNKEKLQVKLRELEKALTQTIESDKNKEAAPGSKSAAGASGDATSDPKRKSDKIGPSEPKGTDKADLAKYAQEAQKKIQMDKERKQTKELKDKELKSKQNLDKKKPEDKESRENKQGKEEKPVKEGKQDKLPIDGKQKTQKKQTDQVLKEEKGKKERRQSDLLFEKLMTQRKQVKEKQPKDKPNAKDIADKKGKALQLLASLPNIKPVEITSSTDTSESFIYGEAEREATKYIVIGTSLEPYISFQKKLESPTEPSRLFKKNIILEDIEETAGMTYQKPMSEVKEHKPKEGPGIIKYQLSNRDFIDKGWTQLPTKKIMRRMNIYRMKPASPQYDWFKRNQKKKVMFYETGERLAEIDEEGRGRWYYKNGLVALEYYNAEDMLVGQRYVVYSSGEECEGGRRKPVTVLALFDYLGNGIVYDYNGNVRLKYNQSEGIVVDPKIGAPSRWKWHTLNEPPVLQQVFVNSRLAMRDPYIEELGQSEPQRPVESFVKQAQQDMLQVELDNFVKEKSQKLMQQFKPFRIKMKAAKLNDQFSLKILDQSKITLIFRDGRTSLKLNLGMNLNNHEIIDTDISDATEVSTPYDKFPAKYNSVANLQSLLHNIRKSNRPHHAKNFTSREDIGHSRVSL